MKSEVCDPRLECDRLLGYPMRHTNYAEIAANYDQRYAEENFTGIELALRDFVGPSAERVLEVGCGTGHWLRLLHSRGVSSISRATLVPARR
jgi:ubiquinone/menaquinone biosynthesis C-methylase UbiE